MDEEIKEERMRMCEEDVPNKSKGKESKENKGGREGEGLKRKRKFYKY